MVDRMDRSGFAQWWWSIDRALLGAFLILIVVGLVLSFAASPTVAERIGADTFYFIKHHAFYVIPATGILIGASWMSPRDVRRAAMVLLAIGLVMLVATLFIGQEVKGSKRWLSFAGLSIQPSEVVKPAFIIVASWLFAERLKRPEMPGNLMAMLLLAVVVGLLLAQPDVGQTLLTVVSWGAIFFVAGLQMFWILGLGVGGAGAVFMAYKMFPHVHARVDRFFAKPDTGPSKFSSDNFQVQTALDSFTNGSWLGRGPGEGTVKKILPDSHTDFVMAVLGEEYGILVCILLVTLFAFIVGRSMWFAFKEEEPFIRLAVVGLATEFGVQSAINMAVNLHLMPAKGMTLPFISYGGSSMLSLAFGMGCLLALTRRRPQATRMVSSMHGE